MKKLHAEDYEVPTKVLFGMSGETSMHVQKGGYEGILLQGTIKEGHGR